MVKTLFFSRCTHKIHVVYYCILERVGHPARTETAEKYTFHRSAYTESHFLLTKAVGVQVKPLSAYRLFLSRNACSILSQQHTLYHHRILNFTLHYMIDVPTWINSKKHLGSISSTNPRSFEKRFNMRPEKINRMLKLI